MSKKKINISIITYAGISYGGAHRQVIRMACALDKKKFNVRFFWCRHNKDIGSSFIFPKLDFNNLKILKKNKVDVVEFKVESRDIRRRYHPWINTNFWTVFNKYETDLVFSARSGHPEYPVSFMKYPVIEWNVFASIDTSKNLVMSVSQSNWVQEKWLKSGGDPSKNTLIYPFVPLPQTEKNLRESLGVRKDEILIGFHQREDDGIYGEQALQAYSMLSSRLRIKTRFVILGGSNKYLALARKLKLDLIKLPIATNFNDVSLFLNSLDIYAHSGGAGETLCIAIQEAMIHSLPIITMDIDNKPNAQISTLKNSGIIVNNVEEYSKKLDFLIRNKGDRIRHGEIAKKNAINEYSEKSCMIKFTNLFFDMHKKYKNKRFHSSELRRFFIIFDDLKYKLFDHLKKNSIIKTLKISVARSHLFIFLQRLKSYKVFLFKLFSQKYRELIISSYSQYGEDLILDKLLNFQKFGFFVDVGTNDPVKFSNTYRFYKKGWSGINIEPNFSLFKKIENKRKLDINLNLGVANKKGQLKFYLINPHTLSTFNKDLANQAVFDGYQIEKEIMVNVLPLREIFNNHLLKKIDFLSIDTEGFELSVLRSNDWKKYRPRYILIEINRGLMEIKNFLNSENYKEIFNNDTNAIFKDTFISL